MVLIPLIITLYTLAFFYNGITSIPYVATVLFTDGTVAPFPEALGFTVSIIIFLLLVLSIGYLTRTTVGRLLESGLDATTNKVPLVRIVCNASRLMAETTFTGAEDFQKPVCLETWPGICMAVFKTGKTTRDDKVVVFMPTVPSITIGFVMKVDPEDIEETGEKVEKTPTRVLSAGFAEQNHVDEFNIEMTEESGDGRVPSNE